MPWKAPIAILDNFGGGGEFLHRFALENPLQIACAHHHFIFQFARQSARKSPLAYKIFCWNSKRRIYILIWHIVLNCPHRRLNCIQRVHGGPRLRITDLWTMVFLQLNKDALKGGGSVINKKWILSAAHLFQSTSLYSWESWTDKIHIVLGKW